MAYLDSLAIEMLRADLDGFDSGASGDLHGGSATLQIKPRYQQSNTLQVVNRRTYEE